MNLYCPQRVLCSEVSPQSDWLSVSCDRRTDSCLHYDYSFHVLIFVISDLVVVCGQCWRALSLLPSLVDGHGSEAGEQAGGLVRTFSSSRTTKVRNAWNVRNVVAGM